MLEKRDGSKAVTLIHRKEGFAFLGIPFGGFIDIDDSEELIRVIEMTGEKTPISLVLHTPGGLVLAATQIAAALANHPGDVTVYVPHYAMSGGTMIALAADKIVMSPSAVLGPIDPQLGDMPAASILAAVAKKDPNEVDDKTLVLADMGAKAQRQVNDFARGLMARHLPAAEAETLARTLTEGRWTHDYPIDANQATAFGLPVSTEMPDEVRLLMRLYPQARGRRPVEYLPTPTAVPERQPGRRASRQPTSR
jgi:ClpP class serine protease